MDINDDGEVRIGGMQSEDLAGAKNRVEQIVKDVEIGDVYEGKVVKLMDFGAFVNILPGKDGLVHISEIQEERVDSVESVLEEGQELKVIVKRIDDQNRIDLSARVDDYLSGELSLEEASQSPRRSRDSNRRDSNRRDSNRRNDRNRNRKEIRRGDNTKPPSLKG
jgi:polyribonucleotide nucleotidyltransferase